MDLLERVPKLNLPVRKAIIQKRNSLPAQRFMCWNDLLEVPGIGPVVLQCMKVYCKDPAASSDILREQPTAGLPTTLGPASSASASGANQVLMVGSNTADQFFVPNLPQQLMVLWTKTRAKRAGEMYQDSGCNRCVAGPDVHKEMHEFLAAYGIVPVQLNKQEEFIFGNNQVEMSDCAFQYVVFLDGKLRGAIDIARIPVPCPGLYSKRMMKMWKYRLDFEKEETVVGAFGLTYPFKDGIPILDIFQMPDSLNNHLASGLTRTTST